MKYRLLISLTAIVVTVIPFSAIAKDEYTSFITCPIFRNAASQCWLAEYEGETYYIGRNGAALPPQLLHKVLVQGVINRNEFSCGARVIEPISISVLPELDHSCNTVLPDNGDRPSEPGLFDILGADPPPPPVWPTTYTTKTFEITFAHGNLFLDFVAQSLITEALEYAKRGNAHLIELFGQTSHSLLNNGEILRESELLAKQRTENIQSALLGLGWPSDKLSIAWSDTPLSAAGSLDSNNRRVTITVRIQPDN